jgi:hypothetical protein
MISIAPKNYILNRVKVYKKEIPANQTDNPVPDENGNFVMDPKIGLKRVSKYLNKHIDMEAFERCLKGEIIMGENLGFHTKEVTRGNYLLFKDVVNKVALSGIHTKMVVLGDGSCAPFIHGWNSTAYKIENSEIENSEIVNENATEKIPTPPDFIMSGGEVYIQLTDGATISVF